MAKKPRVMGMTGKTHGVRFSARPPTKSTSSVSGSPCASKTSVSLFFGSAFFGAAVSGVKPALAFGGAAAAPTLVEVSAETVFGGRQTLSLQRRMNRRGAGLDLRLERNRDRPLVHGELLAAAEGEVFELVRREISLE